MARKRLPTWRAACAVTLAFGLAGQVAGAAAEDATASPAAPVAKAKPKVIEEMVVTGSHIKKAEGDFSTPVLLLSNEALEQQGSQNIADILYELPSVGSPGSSRTNSNFATNGNGVSTVNLRNLGDQRTLVLMNGRRLASGVGGTSTVDLNNIPTDLIERVEVVTGGASAAYGSEAIAGVINFVMKDNFEGIRARVQSGKTSKKDNKRELASFTGGLNFLEHGNVTVNAQFDKDDGLRSKRRTISREDIPFRSSFVPQGLFFTPARWTYGPDGVLKKGFTTAVDGYNRNGQRYISVPVDRKLYTAFAHYDFNEAVTVFFDGTFAKTTSNARLEAFPSANSDARLPDGTEYAGLTLDNPFIPQAIRDDMLANESDTLPFRKRLVGVFDRSNSNDRKFYHYVLGAKGTVLENWDWDAYVSTSKTVEDTSSGTALRSRYFQALDAIADPVTGTPICRSAAARAEGCAPFNPFGLGSVSSAARTYLTKGGAKDTYKADVRQDIGGVNVTGSVFKLPAGDVKVAAGFEARKEKSSQAYSALTQAKDTLSNEVLNTKGDYDVKEAYVEVNVPILRDVTFARAIDFEAAGRSGDYSTVGRVFSWKLGGTWSPIDSIKFRAVYAKATRAPNIGELFQAPAQTFPNGIQDLCEGTTATGAADGTPAAVAAYCRSIPGIAQQIAENGIFVIDDNSDRQSIQGDDLGNPNLAEETAKTTTVGVVFTPEFAPTFSLSVDYFRIKVDNAITLEPRQNTVNACDLSLGTSSLCSRITRELVGNARNRTPGSIFNINSLEANIASIESSGVDVSTRYRLELDENALDLSLAYTFLGKLTLSQIGSPTANNRAQLNGDGRLGAGFKHRANLSATYSRGGFSATWRTTFLSAVQDTRVPADRSLSPGDNRIESYYYNDAQFRYTFGTDHTYDIYLGIDNVLNSRPPPINQNGASNITGTETAADTYDPIGRFVYAGFEAKL